MDMDEVGGVGDGEIVPAGPAIPPGPLRAEQAIEPDGAESADRPGLAVHSDDQAVGDDTREPAALDPDPVRLERVSRRREPVDDPEPAEKGQRQDEQARIPGGGDHRDREQERAAKSKPDAHGAGDEALAAAEHGRVEVGVGRAQREWISVVPKKYGISKAADSGESEPWTALASIDAAKSLRIVPGAALAGSVAPMISRRRAMAPSPSSTIGMHGPCVMKAQRLP